MSLVSDTDTTQWREDLEAKWAAAEAESVKVYAQWARQASAGFLTAERIEVNGRPGSTIVLRRADGEPLAFQESFGETHRVTGQITKMGVTTRRLTRRNKVAMRLLAKSVRDVLVDRYRAEDPDLPEGWATALHNFERDNHLIRKGDGR